MERKEYLQRCQRYAVNQSGVVVFKDIKYYPVAYELSFNDKGEAVHRAILKDIKTNSLIYCRLDDIKESEAKL